MARYWKERRKCSTCSNWFIITHQLQLHCPTCREKMENRKKRGKYGKTDINESIQ